MEVFYLEKLCRKNPTEVAVTGGNQTLSVKKMSQPTSSEEGEPRRESELLADSWPWGKAVP